MAIDFPNSPSINDQYTVGDRTWTWNGTYWQTSTSMSTFTASDSEPVDADAGDIWFDSAIGKTFINYNNVWVEIGNAATVVDVIADADADTKVQVESSADEDKIRISTAGTERMIVDNVGNVGIGTTSPSTTLHVDGSILANDSVTIGDGGDYVAGSIYSDANWGMIFRAKQASPAQADFRWANSADTERMRIDSSGNVGIGTTSPSEKLDINAGTSGSVELTTTAGRTIQLTANDSEPFLSVGSTTAHSAAIMTNGVRRLTIDSGGDVGIGVTSITNQFEVYNGTYYSIIGRKDWGLRSTGTYALSTSNGANVYISSNGTFYRSTSSGKYKTDVEDMNTDAADVVFALRPVWFRSTSPLDPEGWSYYGLIAEEVAEIDPRLVSFGAKEDCGCDFDADHVAECLAEPEGVYYDRLVPHLISVVQRQQEQIDALTARIEALEVG